MNLCDFRRVGESDDYRCQRCGLAVNNPAQVRLRGHCHVQPPGVHRPPVAAAEPPAPSQGPGAELKRLLHQLGMRPGAACQCHARAAEMDRRGAAWCRENIAKIVGWLREEVERRKQQHARQLACHQKDCQKPHPGPLPLALRLPFCETAARAITLLAVRRAEKVASARRPGA